VASIVTAIYWSRQVVRLSQSWQATHNLRLNEHRLRLHAD